MSILEHVLVLVNVLKFLFFHPGMSYKENKLNYLISMEDFKCRIKDYLRIHCMCPGTKY